uniref:non-specific serine/threonine protein kinase n=1 Tax=Caenorhabditis tropicalis TaxID=1561998 RepID=A0A1I7U276_9PELO
MSSTQPSSSREEDVPGTSESAIYEANTQLVITTKKKKKISEKEYQKRGFLRVESGHYINDYKMIKTLGRGTYGTVWLAKHTKSNTYAAMKISRSSEHLCDMAMREIDVRVFYLGIGFRH